MSHAPMKKTNTTVKITATVAFKLWIDQNVIDHSGEYSLEAIAQEHLAEHINDHPDIKANIESIDYTEVSDPGLFVEEAVQRPACHTFYFEKKEVNHISEWDVCSGCPTPEYEQ